MKTSMLFRIIALAAIIGFSLVSCGDGAGGGSGDPALPGSISISVQSGVAAEVGCTLKADYSGGGSETVAYQWNKNGSALAGKTGVTLTTDAAGSYSVTVSAAGFTSKTSNSIIVNVPDVFTPALLEITINRALSTPDNFVFSTNDLGADADAYKAFKAGSQVATSATNTVSVPAASLSDRDWTELTAKAFKSAADASLSTKLPGMVKYPTATVTKEGYTDWFNFLDATLDGLAFIGVATPSYVTTLSNSIKDILNNGYMVGEPEAVYYKGEMATDLNNATAIVMSGTNFDDIVDFFNTYSDQEAAAPFIKSIKETMPRLWFNKVMNSTNDTSFGTILIPAIKTEYPQVNIE